MKAASQTRAQVMVMGNRNYSGFAAGAKQHSAVLHNAADLLSVGHEIEGAENVGPHPLPMKQQRSLQGAAGQRAGRDASTGGKHG